MTHSLHRCGDYLEDDYVWLMYQTKGVNDNNIEEKARKFLDVVEEVGSENWGDVKSGPIVKYSSEEIRSKISHKSRLRGVFTSKQKVIKFLRRIKEENIGLSVTISGLLEQVLSACRQAGVEPHTVNYSLGIFGKKELLADEGTLSITTMCGHHLVPDGVVKEMGEKVRKNRISPEEAARELAKLCPCGIFNHVRAAKLLRLEKERIRPSDTNYRPD